MPYAASGLALLNSVAGSSVFIYRTPDTFTTVLGAGYFNSAAAQMNAGDEILVIALSAGSNVANVRLRVRSVASGVVTVELAHIPAATLFLPVTAVATTDYAAINLPPCTLIRATTRTTTAYGAVTNANLTLGTTLGGGEVIASVDIKAAGVIAHTIVAAQAGFAGGSLFPRITQVGGNSAVGAANFTLEYMPT